MQSRPEHISVTGLLKAMPHEEGGERFVYIEGSNETRDYQGERVMCKALEASRDYFLRYGNIDLDHLTLLGPMRGIADYHLYEIGQPVAVEISAPHTFIKAQLYKGESAAARHAEEVWASMTQQSPPARWYPSIGGSVLAKAQSINATGEPETIVSEVRWANIGLSKTPVNLSVPTIATMPFGVFAKAWSATGFDLAKALDASGAGSDAAALTGGAALGRQSLDRTIHTYWQFREEAAGALTARKIPANATQIHRYAVAHGVPEDEAAEWVERFMSDIRNKLKRKAA